MKEDSPSLQKKRILVIDDDPLVGDSLKNLLEKGGLEVVHVTLGLAALDFIARQTFALVIADIRMPGMNGLETLKAIRELRSQFRKRPIPEIVITAYDDSAVKKEATRMGVRAFFLKPFELHEFVAALEKILNLRGKKRRFRLPKEAIQIK